MAIIIIDITTTIIIIIIITIIIIINIIIIIRNEIIREAKGIRKLSEKIQEKRLMWWGHGMRKEGRWW